MKQAKVSELKNNLSRYLSYVRRGGVVRVFDRDRAVAELVPIGQGATGGSDERDGILDALARKGSVLAKTLRAAGVKVSDDALDNRAMAHMVARGRARYFYSFDYIIAHTIRSEQLENELTLIQPELGGESLHLLVSRQLPENVARRIIGAFARIEARGDYARLLAQYALSNKPGKK